MLRTSVQTICSLCSQSSCKACAACGIWPFLQSWAAATLFSLMLSLEWMLPQQCFAQYYRYIEAQCIVASTRYCRMSVVLGDTVSKVQILPHCCGGRVFNNVTCLLILLGCDRSVVHPCTERSTLSLCGELVGLLQNTKGVFVCIHCMWVDHIALACIFDHCCEAAMLTLPIRSDLDSVRQYQGSYVARV